MPPIFDPQGLLAGVQPQLAAKAMAIHNQCLAQGIPLRVTSGYRTVAEQDALYAQGRTTSGNKVTNARGGQSYHNFRLAVDLWPVNDRGSVLWKHPSGREWNKTDGIWQDIGRAGRAVGGLRWGGDFTTILDLPHWELPIPLTLAQLREAYAAGGEPGVDQAVSSVLPTVGLGIGGLALLGGGIWLLKPWRWFR